MTGEALEVRSDIRKPSWTLFEHQSASFSINQHQSASISINQHQSALISINQHQIASMSTISQHQSASVSISQHQLASISIRNWFGKSIYTGINAPTFWGAWGGYRGILRSVRMLCEKVVRGRLQELLSKLKICVTIQMPDSKTSALLLDKKTTVNNGRWLTWPGAGRATLEHKAGLRDVY